jgi:Transposase domain (DUF772)
MTTLEPRTTFRPGVVPLAQRAAIKISTPATLAEAVNFGAMEVEKSRLKTGGLEADGLAFEPRIMLALLTYCYARQILSSSDVWSQLRRDADLCRLCGNNLPGPGWIRTFREENREALHECLTVALLFLIKQKAAAGNLPRTEEAQIRMEARRRIVMAACMDGLEMDDVGGMYEA